MAEDAAAAAGAVVTAAAAAPAQPEKLEPMEALRQTLKRAMALGTLRCGLHECCKALERGARVCCLAQNCDQPEIVKLVKALCAQHSVPLVEVPTREDLGQWSGLTRQDEDGNPKKAVKCSVSVVLDFGAEIPQLRQLLDSLKA